jgi:hypothetical protein
MAFMALSAYGALALLAGLVDLSRAPASAGAPPEADARGAAAGHT